jgi:hypothetical protein
MSVRSIACMACAVLVMACGTSPARRTLVREEVQSSPLAGSWKVLGPWTANLVEEREALLHLEVSRDRECHERHEQVRERIWRVERDRNTRTSEAPVSYHLFSWGAFTCAVGAEIVASGRVRALREDRALMNGLAGGAIACIAMGTFGSWVAWFTPNEERERIRTVETERRSCGTDLAEGTLEGPDGQRFIVREGRWVISQDEASRLQGALRLKGEEIRIARPARHLFVPPPLPAAP